MFFEVGEPVCKSACLTCQVNTINYMLCKMSIKAEYLNLQIMQTNI